MHLFDRGRRESAYGDMDFVEVVRRGERGETSCVMIRWRKEYQGSVLHKGITVYYREKVGRQSSRQLRSYFVKNKCGQW